MPAIPERERGFKTLKYAPDFPDRFGSIEDARVFVRPFLDFYNHEHRRSRIGLHTTASVHLGTADGWRFARRGVMNGDASYYPRHAVAATTLREIVPLLRPLELPDTSTASGSPPAPVPSASPGASPSPAPSFALASRGEAQDASFSLTIETDGAQVIADEPIRTTTTLRYIGESEDLTVISHGGGPVSFGVEQLDGRIDNGPEWDASATPFTYRRGDVQDIPFQKSGGWDGDDPMAGFWRAWFADRAAPRPPRSRRSSPPGRPPDRRTSGPGRTSGAFSRPVASVRHRWESAPHGRRVARTVEWAACLGRSASPSSDIRLKSPRRWRGSKTPARSHRGVPLPGT